MRAIGAGAVALRKAALTGLLVLGGCAGVQSPPPSSVLPGPGAPAAGEAVVYVFRPSSPPYLLAPGIHIDGRKLSELPNRSYFIARLAPGTHLVRADWSAWAGVPDAQASFTLHGGQTYYLAIANHASLTTLTPVGGMVFPSLEGRGSLTLVDAATAEDELRKCRRVDLPPAPPAGPR